MINLTIREFVARAEDFVEDERTPFAEDPWTQDSEVIWKEGDDTTPIVEGGKVFGYFLEPSLILEIREWMPDESPEALITRVINYAKNDA